MHVSRAKWGHRIALDIARGVCYLHDRHIVHFDLKSNNILLARDGTAKIADVGLARVLTGV
jgi:serine/threonine protein kinase